MLRVLGDGASLTFALAATVDRLPDPRERALGKELCFGVLRWQPRLEAVVDRLIERPLRERDRNVRLVLLLGLYQLIYTRVPPYAAVTATVDLAGSAGKRWAAGLVNAVLRRFQRERDVLLRDLDGTERGKFAHPDWLTGVIRGSWPEDWAQVLAANNAHPPFTVRVNARRITRAAYLELLAKAGREGQPAPHTTHGVILSQALDVEALPGFTEGLVSVQDAAAQLAAPLLHLAPGQRVLDACAAPGGKTAHILEQEPGLVEVVALDRDPRRLDRLGHTLGRLGLDAGVLCADAGEPASWWDGRPFERILLDAPCTATGVIRRHPDIKALRRPEQVPQLAARQARLLEALWPLLAPGGTLLYATCSVLREENEAQIARFAASREDLIESPLPGDWGRPCRFGRQILPGEDGMDGFFYALLKKG